LVEMANRPASSSVPPAKASSAAPPEPPPVDEADENVSLLVGPSLLYSTGLRSGIHVLSTLTYMPFERAGLSASVLAPVLPAQLVRPEGTVELYTTFYRLGAVLEVTGKSPKVSLRLTAAAGLGRLQLLGQASSAYASATESRFVACPSLGVTARFALASSLRFFVDATGSTAFPKTVVRVAGREAADFGRPSLGAALGLELSAPVGAP
jgi:hypothetical protein